MSESALAEQNVIGCLLLDSDSISEVSTTLEPIMFTDELYGAIYCQYLRGYENHYDVNMTVIVDKLKCEKYPQQFILQVLNEALNSVFTSANIRTYADIVQNSYKANKATKILSTVNLSSNTIKTDLRDLCEELEALQDNRSYESKSLAKISSEWKDYYFQEHNTPKNNLGFERLDEIIGGLEGGDVIVIGARPAVGKSAFATQITSNLAKLGKRVGFYNLEMKEKQMYERFIVNSSGISLTRLKRAVKFLGDEKERFEKANEELARAENIIITTGSKTVSEIRSECRHMDYDVLVIDYLQLIKSDVTYRGNRYAEVGAISKAIKDLAMEMNIAVVLLSQLNRTSEGRETKEPTMSELRESGDIEQDASVIVLLWNLNEERIKKGCKVEKNRQGNTGKVVMQFNGDLMRFEETSEDVKEASQWKSNDSDCPFA